LIDTKLTPKQREGLLKVKFEFLQEIQKPHIRGYKLTSNKAKVYEKHGPVFYNFKLEKWSELDRHVVAAFASPDKKDLETLRRVVRSCLDHCPHKGLKNIKDLLIEEKSLSSPLRSSRLSRS